MLFYPEVYLLDGGYRSFYKAHPDRCDGSYVKMRAQQDCDGDDTMCEDALDQSRKSWKRHKSTDFTADDLMSLQRRSSSSF